MRLLAGVVLVILSPLLILAVAFGLLGLSDVIYPRRREAWIGRCSCGHVTEEFAESIDAWAALDLHTAVTQRAECAILAIRRERTRRTPVLLEDLVGGER